MLERVSVGDLEGTAPLPKQIIDRGHHGDANLLAMGLNQ